MWGTLGRVVGLGLWYISPTLAARYMLRSICFVLRSTNRPCNSSSTMMQGTALLALSVLLLLVFQKIIEFRRAVHSVNNHPGYRLLLNTLGPIENFFPRVPGITPGGFHMWRRKHKDFESHGWDVITYVSAFLGSKTNFYVADPDAIKEITTHRARFPKPVEQYKLLTFFGNNIVASEGEEWKRYRKITAPAFSERNNRLVWDETILIVQDLFNNVWGDQEEIAYNHAVDLTLPMALFVIGVAGFGRRIFWKEDELVPPGHKLTFKGALHTVAKEVFTKLVVPDWVLKLGLTESHRQTTLAFDELHMYLVEMIRARKESEKKEERYDLFSSLLDANEEEEDGQVKLQDSELIGNLFIFLIAGHETTAHTLCYVFAMLAMHPEEQETLYEHIKTKSVIQDGGLLDYECMNALPYCGWVLNETLRMFPPVHSIPKSVAEDTTITISNAEGKKTTIPMPQGSSISMHTPGLHYNPRYWEDPHTFKPKRFMDDKWPRDAFLPFNAGPRACLGRRFTETESVAVIAMIVSRYKIDIKEDPKFAHETADQRRRRVLRSKPGLSMTPLKVPLVFRRRQETQ